MNEASWIVLLVFVAVVCFGFGIKCGIQMASSKAEEAKYDSDLNHRISLDRKNARIGELEVALHHSCDEVNQALADTRKKRDSWKHLYEELHAALAEFAATWAGPSKPDADLEKQITGQSWKDCACCGKVRIPAVWNPALCDNCGGPRVNCIHCGTGKSWWSGDKPPFTCYKCGKNPLEAKNG